MKLFNTHKKKVSELLNSHIILNIYRIECVCKNEKPFSSMLACLLSFKQEKKIGINFTLLHLHPSYLSSIFSLFIIIIIIGLVFLYFMDHPQSITEYSTTTMTMIMMMILTSTRANYCVTHFHHAVIISDKCLHNCRFSFLLLFSSFSSP